MNKSFKELEDGAVFKFKDNEFKKIPVVKVSCCRSYNSESTSNANQRIFVKPDEQVEIND